MLGGSRLGLGAVASLLALGLAACGGSGSDSSSNSGNGSGGQQESAPLRVGTNTNAAVLPARVADAKGLFGPECNNIHWTLIEDLTTMVPAAGKSLDIIEATPTDVIQSNAQGIGLVAVAGQTIDTDANPTIAVIASAKSGIKQPKDMEGKTLAVLSPTGTLHVATMAWFQQQGVDISKIHTVTIPAPSLADQLKSGRVDAVESLSPFREVILKQPGVTNLGDSYLKISDGSLAGLVWASKSDWAKAHTAQIACFKEGIQKGIDYIASHDAEARDVLGDYTGLPAETVANTHLPNFTPDVRVADFQVWLDAMKAVSGFKGDVQPQSLVLQGS